MQEIEYDFLGFIVPYPLPLWGNPISIREFFAFGTTGIGEIGSRNAKSWALESRS